ncbi:MAG: proteasome accessory factor PafA2 family protein [Myxococcota bacterium]
MSGEPPPPLGRLAGMETEYAVRYSPSPHEATRPSNKTIFESFVTVLRKRFTLHRGQRFYRDQWFTQNGGALYYESLTDQDGGLIEGATPECRGPGQLLLYQRALDQLLLEALPEVMEELPHRGSVGLLKNCRDAQGHIYGAQENYEATLAEGLALVMYRLGLLLLLPCIVVTVVCYWFMFLAFILTVIVALLGLFGYAFIRPDRAEALIEDPSTLLNRRLHQVLYGAELISLAPTWIPMAVLLSAFAFRRQRQAMMGFMISRPILSGAGTVDDTGRLWLSEKATGTRATMRTSLMPEARGIVDPTNLVKAVLHLIWFDTVPLRGLFQRRQRLQIGMADSNMLEWAEYLKFGTTLLMLDMAEAGYLDDAPRPQHPIQALHTLNGDPTLQAKVAIQGRDPMSALDLQRDLLERAEAWLAETQLHHLEAHDVVRRWRQTLDDLEADPGRLVGRLDWVTKRFLLESCAETPDPTVLKKIDLRYHELGSGYLAQLQKAGATEQLLRDDQIQHAMTEPPTNTRAFIRSKLMREYSSSELPVQVSWGSVKIGGFLRGKVIRLSPRQGKGSDEAL